MKSSKKLVEPYAGRVLKPHAKPGDYILIGPPTPRSQGREVWFGGVQIKKNYVSYHLMPVYAFPDLLDGLSPELKKRMQGKSLLQFQNGGQGVVQRTRRADQARLSAL